MNKIILIGRLTKDPDLRYTNSGKAVANFTLAVNRPFQKDGVKEADFISIVVWGNQAESCSKYLGKGKMAGVDGRLQIRTYDTEDGGKKWITEVVADHVEFLSPKSEGQNANAAPNTNSGFGEEIVFDNNDLPF